MAKGKRNSQKRKKFSRGNDDGENENDDEGKYNEDTVVVPLGIFCSWSINPTDLRKPISALFVATSFRSYNSLPL